MAQLVIIIVGGGLLSWFFIWILANGEKVKKEQAELRKQYWEQEAEYAARNYRVDEAASMRFSYAFAASCCDGSRFAAHAHGAVAQRENGPQRPA